MEPQKTIEKTLSLEGRGLQTGRPVKITFSPSEENTGIIFTRTDLPGKPSVRIGKTEDLSSDRRTKISLGEGQFIETTEHVLAALWALGIDNIKIELAGSEPPAMDGSALAFLQAFESAGVKPQEAEKNFIEIKEPVWVEDRESFLGIFPSGIFKISYLLDFRREGVKKEAFSGAVTREFFKKEIAPARTIWLVPPGLGTLKLKAFVARLLGYGRGADEKNTLIITKNGAANEPRFPDEFVRHKVLDLIGDLYLLGRPVKGRLIAVRSGHELNLKLVKKIIERGTR